MTLPPPDDPAVQDRSQALLAAHEQRIFLRTDRLFAYVMVLQWVFGVVAALWISPRTWIGETGNLHLHVWAAIFLGGTITSLPVALAVLCPGQRLTRHTIAIGQMLMTALLIHLTGGRIETHFHVFGSLAFLSFYRDWRLIASATAVVGLDHLLRGIYWPQSVFGVLSASPWRVAEHVGWVLFEDLFLLISMRQSRAEMVALAQRQSRLETLHSATEAIVAARTQDLTREVAQRQETQAQVLKLSRAVDQTDDLLVITDCEGRIEYVNPAFERHTGHHHKAVDGQNMRILNSGQHSRDFYQAFWTRILAGGTFRGVFTNRKRDGELYFEDKTVSPILDPSGTITHFISVGRDITEQRRDEEKRNLMEIQLRQAQKLESIGQLAAGIAHEINTPTQFIGDNTRFIQDAFADLQGVIALQNRLLEMARSGPLPSTLLEEWSDAIRRADLDFALQEVPRALNQSLDGIERVSEIVRAMKEFSHPGATAKVPLDLNRAIQSTLTVCRNEWKHAAELVLNLDPALPPVHVLPGEFNQVILNLVINATHAIADVIAVGTYAKGTLTLCTALEANHAVIRVTDNGTGIPAAVRGRIFDPFFTTKGVGKGTGQGLAIARSVIVDKHGGTLEFTTEPGRGTTFVITLPLRRESLAAQDPESQPSG